MKHTQTLADIVAYDDVIVALLFASIVMGIVFVSVCVGQHLRNQRRNTTTHGCGQSSDD